MIPDRQNDHVEQGVDLLIGQYQDKPRLEAWLAVYLKQCQLFEDATYDVLIKRLIDFAVGVQLEALGRIVGEGRQGREDEIYRVFIRARVRINRSLGTVPDLLDVLGMIDDTDCLFDEYYPAGMLFEFEDHTLYDPIIVFRMLRDTKAGGVRLNMVVPTTTLDNRFLWSDVGDPDEPSTNGYGDAISEGSWGLLSDAIVERETADGRSDFYTPPAAPVLASITPDNGPAAGGTSVTLTGTHLTGVVAVRFDVADPGMFFSSNATSVTVIDDNTIHCVTQAHAEDTVSVWVRTVTAVAHLETCFTFGSALHDLTAWWRDFVSMPHHGTVSLGTSGAHELDTTGSNPTSVSQNGHAAANYNGTTNYRKSADTYSAFANSGSSGTGTWLLFFRALSASANGNAGGGTPHANPGLISTDGSGPLSISFCDDGVQAGYFDGSTYIETPFAEATIIDDHVVTMKYDGTHLKMRVDRGPWLSVSGAGPWTTIASQKINEGANFDHSLFFHGRVQETRGAARAISDAEADTWLVDIETRYGVTIPDYPTITLIAPSSGAATDTIVITGTNYGTAEDVTIGGTSASYSVDSSTQITATVPAGSGSADVKVITAGGTATEVGGFTYSGFDPAALVDCLSWHDTRAGVTQSGGTVSALADQGPSGDSNRNLVQATTASQPAWNASDADFNGQPTLTFDGVDDLLQSVGDWAASAPYAQPTTWIFVLRADSGVGLGFYIFDGPPSGASRQTWLGETPYAGNQAPTAPIPIAQTIVLGIVFDGVSSSVYINDPTTPVATADAGSNTLAGQTIAARFSNDSASWLAMRLAAVGTFASNDHTERADIFAALLTRYGI